VAILGEPELLANARELTASVRANVTIDWTIRDNVRAQLRVRAGAMRSPVIYSPGV
jgi:type I restriction enzyme R subunit